MRFRLLSLLFFAASIQAANEDEVASLVELIPTCGATCLLSAIDDAGCDLTNYECHCVNRASFEKNTSNCLTVTCSDDEIHGVFLLILSRLVYPCMYRLISAINLLHST